MNNNLKTWPDSIWLQANLEGDVKYIRADLAQPVDTSGVDVQPTEKSPPKALTEALQCLQRVLDAGLLLDWKNKGHMVLLAEILALLEGAK